MKVAVFDVCGTLYDSNTTFDFLDSYFSDNRSYKTFRALSRTLVGKLLNYPLYRILQYDLIRIIAIGYLKGTQESQIKLAAKEFVNDSLQKNIKTDVAALYQKYQQQGYRMVLMSGSLAFIVEAVADSFSADQFYATNLSVEQGNFTGLIANDQLFNKKESLESEYAKIDKLVVVSDNLSDFELIKCADKAYVICNKAKHKKFWDRKNLTNIEILD